MKKIKSILLTFAATLATLLPAVALPVAVHAAADIQGSVCSGAELKFSSTPGTCSSTTTGAENKINQMVTLIINIFSVLVGIIAVIMIIIGGIKYVTSGGEANNITSAKNTIMYAIIGLIIVALAQILVRYVLARVTAP